ncbi:undecaprenyl-diphosphate phosphatase [Ramlibacter aquaticus]|uniref:Undecaprenyl-diphosphatase n=1 Tax=Ramlibacter aquaticus TaxID=2780094 RepID=A0ABR9SKD8_9BURK|nr:undecaprenyl-diphosphate phosphatase [Ramlibacter aquaticus]MBE7942834.1 undecaprenyl-diphosphate phosphatase [Ramlibacter aquaticus]
MTLLQIVLLALVQGAAELLPVSSSAHVILAEKWMGLDPSSPQMTFLLVMLHTGTMFAVIAYFWAAWRRAFFSSWAAFRDTAARIALSTAATGVIGFGILQALKHSLTQGSSSFEIESLFGNTQLIAAALVAAGLLILVSSRASTRASGDLNLRRAAWIGAVQGLCLPFRGFSRSGATISAGMLLGVGRRQAEEFSFLLAVVLTPPVIVREGWRLMKAQALSGSADATGLLFLPGIEGMAFSFVAGLLALRWLSRWLEAGRWYLFGLYCLAASAIVWTFGS